MIDECEILGGAFAPVTWEIGFLEASAEVAADAFCRWQAPIHANRGVRLDTRSLQGPFAEMLCALSPLTSIEPRRYLFLPTRSEWTAYFDNGHQGPDVPAHVSYLAGALGCRGVRAVAVPDRRELGETAGAVMLEIYGPRPLDFLNYERSISVANDGRRWRFEEFGERFPFEDSNRYEAPKVRDRFTTRMLGRYLLALGGIRVFDDDFYESRAEAIVVGKHGPTAPGLTEHPLAPCDARMKAPERKTVAGRRRLPGC